MEIYKHLNKYLKEKFGERTLKICIDGGFTCPNRDGSKGIGGCIFCSEKGSGEHIKNNINNTNADNSGYKLPITPCSSNYIYTNDDTTFVRQPIANQQNFLETSKAISNQVQNFFDSYKAQRANKFIAYFQNFTNTYDTLENLKAKYDAALIDDRIVGLEVATRPDCITEDVAKLLKSYTNKYYVCIELGLQTANEETGKYINRCYTNKDFSNAIDILNKYQIDVVAHIMIGLPNNTCKEKSEKYNAHEEIFPHFYSSNFASDTIETVNFINNQNIQGLKIHSCYIVKNTKLEKLYIAGEYVPLSLEEYLEGCAYVLTHINPNIVIHRISGDAPKDLLVAPSWNLHKKWIINGLDKYLNDNDLWQGKFYDLTTF